MRDEMVRYGEILRDIDDALAMPIKLDHRQVDKIVVSRMINLFTANKERDPEYAERFELVLRHYLTDDEFAEYIENPDLVWMDRIKSDCVVPENQRVVDLIVNREIWCPAAETGVRALRGIGVLTSHSWIDADKLIEMVEAYEYEVDVIPLQLGHRMIEGFHLGGETWYSVSAEE